MLNYDMQFPFAQETIFNEKNNKKNTDPRIPIAQHMGWVGGNGTYTEFASPEPDNYNHAILMDRPIDCPLPFIRNQIWYAARFHSGWWSVYHVPQGHLNEFRSWLATLYVKIYWYTLHPGAMRDRKKLLWNRKGAYNLTNNEILYVQGYYENLRVKYFSEDDKMFESQVGVPREDIYRHVLTEE